MTSLARYLRVWRTTVVRDREIIDGEVRPEHRGPSPQLAEALGEWPGSHYWADGDGEGKLVLIRSLAPAPRERWWLHGLLFVVSFFTVWMGGALLAGAQVRFTGVFRIEASAVVEWVSQLNVATGLDFAIALMAILLAHEMGHYVFARRYTINVSPPYFLPAPPWINFIGTFGAFIRLRSPVVDRRQLMDVGAAGPWAGFVVALAAFVIGIAKSQVLPTGEAAQQLLFGDARIFLGDSILTMGVRQLIVGDAAVALHPLAQAGWFGILVTMLNLLPLGQLDGGHVLYALVKDYQRWVGWLVWLGLLFLGLRFAPWLLWAGFTLLLGGGRIGHPNVLDRHRPLPPSRRPIGWATVLLFVVTFTPIPLTW